MSLLVPSPPQSSLRATPSRRRATPMTMALVAALTALAVSAAGDGPWTDSSAGSHSVVPVGGVAGLDDGARPGAPPVKAVDSRASAAFLAAWRRSLTTSWALDEAIMRTTTGGRQVTFVVRRAQRPPDWIRVGGGSVDAQLGGRVQACATVGGAVRCRTSGTVVPYGPSVDAELATLGPYVTGGRALYAVSANGQCFELALRFSRYPVPPYGSQAEFCFDPRSGAPAGSTVHRAEAVDVTVVERAHAPATDADLVVPPDAQVANGALTP